MERLTQEVGALKTISKASSDIGFLKQIILKLAKYEDVGTVDELAKAKEKQIIKTPVESYYNEGDYTWECVNCEETVDEGQNYCHYCGQKLLEWD